jgi:hypothetical protein
LNPFIAEDLIKRYQTAMMAIEKDLGGAPE